MQSNNVLISTNLSNDSTNIDLSKHTTPRLNLVFIDSNVPDYAYLAAGVIPGAEVIILKPDCDGIKQITEVLKSYSYSVSLHIVSHGSPGCLYLGNIQLSLDTLAEYAEDLKTWFSQSPHLPISPSPNTQHPTPDTLILYGCNVAAGDAGEEFISKLHDLTGAEIAASTTRIGNADKGGNWELDVTTGFDKLQLAFTEELQRSYSAVLDISGTVYNDYDNDGTQETGNTASEVGLEGITVTAYDSTGAVVDTANTDASGAYTLTTGGVDVRIEFTNLPDGFVPSARTGSSDVSNVFFATGTGVTANFGVLDPDNYITSALDPILITSCFIDTGTGNSTDTAIVSVLHSASGANPTKVELADIADVGAVYGLAYNKETGDLFVGAFQKRFADVGTDGNGAIYRLTGLSETNNASNADRPVNTFIDLAAYNLAEYSEDDSAGVYSHGDNGRTITNRDDGDISSNEFKTDQQAFNAVGKVALGDVEISSDRQHIWTINLHDRRLYKIEIGDGSDYAYDVSETRTVERYDILDQGSGGIDPNTLGINAQQNIRPFALTEKDGLIYVGMVNSAQYDAAGATGNTTASDLHAYIYTFNPTTGTFSSSPVLDFDLDYERDLKLDFPTPEQSANWTPWVDNHGTTAGDGLEFQAENASTYWASKTQPILSDIEFDNDGSMIVGFRDRTADQSGHKSADTDPNNGTEDIYSTASGGDILRASLTGANQWTIEASVTDTDTDLTTNPEFYNQERYTLTESTYQHKETAQGGIAQIPGYGSIETTALDPVDYTSGGIIGLSDSDGTQTRGIELFSNGNTEPDPIFFGKGSGLGDLEFLGELAPIAIGNRVWNDTDADGIQDAGETNLTTPINLSGLTVKLFNETGSSELASITTNSNGEYFFNDSNVTGGLTPNTTYQIQFTDSTFQSINISAANQGINDEIDSDATVINSIPVISVTTGDFGENKYSYDLGVHNQDLDYGDAPDSLTTTSTGDYDTIKDHDGASHVIVSGITIGANVDADDGSLENSGANADDNLGSVTAGADNNDDGVDDGDEDGVTLTHTKAINRNDADDSYSVEVIVNAPTSVTRVVEASDDFDSNTNSGGAGKWVGNWTTVTTGEIGTGLAQYSSSLLRINDDNQGVERQVNLSSATDDATLTFNYSQEGLSSSQNYLVQVADSPTGSFSTVFTIDNSTTASSTPTNASGNITIAQSLLSTGTTTIRIVPGSGQGHDSDDAVYIDDINISAPTDATLVGWIDFDRSGTFDEDEAAVLNTSDTTNPLVTDGSTANTLTWTGFKDDFNSGTPLGDTYARFRFSTDNNLDATFSTGAASDGEVEDYKLVIADLDYGDAPDADGTTGTGNYDTTVDTDDTTTDVGGAGHIIDSNLKLGDNIDADTGLLQDSNATADDTDIATNDEDGITFTSVLDTSDTSYSVSVNLTNTNSSEPAALIGWIDFDRSGTFDVGEAVSRTIAANSGTDDYTLTWDNTDINNGDGNGDLPGTGALAGDALTSGDTYARFRLSTDTDLTTSLSTGLVDDGEVEDYLINIKNNISGDGRPNDLTNNTAGVDDIFVGGAGQDTLTGNGGDDCFHFNRTSDGIDIIEDFSSGDKLDFSDFFVTGGELAGIPNPFGTYVEALPIGSSGTLIQIDFENSNNDLLKKNVVYLNGYDTSITAMTAADFIF